MRRPQHGQGIGGCPAGGRGKTAGTAQAAMLGSTLRRHTARRGRERSHVRSGSVMGLTASIRLSSCAFLARTSLRELSHAWE